MNQEEIVSFLVSQKFHATLTNNGTKMSVEFKAGDRLVVLGHKFPEHIRRLPCFYLINSPSFGILAHVLHTEADGLGAICVQDRDSISVNFEVPALAYKESLQRHIDLIKKLIENPVWNRQELLREFHSNWFQLCYRENPDMTSLFIAGDISTPCMLQIKKPYGRKDKWNKHSVYGSYFAFSQLQQNNKSIETLQNTIRWSKREVTGKVLIISLCDLEPAPFHSSDLIEWYVTALKHLNPTDHDEMIRFKKHMGKNFWLVFRASTSSGDTSFAIRFRTNKKSKIPTTLAESKGWVIEPFNVRSLERNVLLPRGGGSLDLSTKSVLLVGCGSVGSEIAHRLAAAGVGNLTISDPDVFSEDNLYRHTLEIRDIGYWKTYSVANDLQEKYPLIVVTPKSNSLLYWANQKLLEDFDLVVVAIGAPTEERAFHAYIEETGVSTPILNTWLEAFGIGGHAILDLPQSTGCFRCAYVDLSNFTRGLSSNLNFLEPNQDVTKTHAGCGTQFLPYSGVSASYTATMATDLASQFLHGKIKQSSQISWKGNADIAQKNDFETTYRYKHFTKTLEVLPLFNSECDVCSD